MWANLSTGESGEVNGFRLRILSFVEDRKS